MTDTNILNNAQIIVEKGTLLILIEKENQINNTSLDFKPLLNSKNINDLFTLLDIDVQGCSLNNFNEKTLIVFPIKLVKNLTIIHKAQLQTLKLLQKIYNIQINILIVGGSNIDKVLVSDMNNFEEQLQKILSLNNMHADINKLHNFTTNSKVKEKYLKLLDEVKLVDVQAFKLKNYKDRTKKEREFLNESIATATDILNVYSYICSNDEELKSKEDIEKSIILAGSDESNAWYGLFDSETLCRIAGIFIPRLSVDNHDFDQSVLKTIIPMNELYALLSNNESGEWFVKMFFLQPLFSTTSSEEIKDILDVLKEKTNNIKLDIDDEESILKLLKLINNRKFVKLIT